MKLLGERLHKLRLKVSALGDEFDRASATYAHAVQLLERSNGHDGPEYRMALELAQEARDELIRCEHELDTCLREFRRLENGRDGP